jgi:hypothetical protein
MSVHERADRNWPWRVQWRASDGQQRSRSFLKRTDALAFDRKLRERKRERTRDRALRDIGPARKARQQVYVIGNGSYVKIGISANPAKRLSEMQTGSPMELRPFWLIGTADASRLEAALHARYAAHRTRGEWYDAAPVLADLASLAELGACHFRRAVAAELPAHARNP